MIRSGPDQTIWHNPWRGGMPGDFGIPRDSREKASGSHLTVLESTREDHHPPPQRVSGISSTSKSCLTRTDIERVREMTNLASLIGEHIALTPKGREHVGLCPFHDDKNPSFSVGHGQGKSLLHLSTHVVPAGDCLPIHCRSSFSKDFSEAIEFLADRVGIQLEQTGSGKPDPERSINEHARPQDMASRKADQAAAL